MKSARTKDVAYKKSTLFHGQYFDSNETFLPIYEAVVSTSNVNHLDSHSSWCQIGSLSTFFPGGRQDAVLRHATPKIGKSSDGSIFWRISILTKVNEAIL